MLDGTANVCRREEFLQGHAAGATDSGGKVDAGSSRSASRFYLYLHLLGRQGVCVVGELLG
jgi:hypothetical protein